MKCPFKVGDRIHEVASTLVRVKGKHKMGKCKIYTYDHNKLDSTKPDAIVVAMTKKGFSYQYEKPVVIGRVSEGFITQSGEVYPEGYNQWRKIL